MLSQVFMSVLLGIVGWSSYNLSGAKYNPHRIVAAHHPFVERLHVTSLQGMVGGDDAVGVVVYLFVIGILTNTMISNITTYPNTVSPKRPIPPPCNQQLFEAGNRHRGQGSRILPVRLPSTQHIWFLDPRN